MRYLGPDFVDQYGVSAFGYTFTPTIADQTLRPGGQYVIGIHTVSMPNMGQGRSFLAVPNNGVWITTGRGFDVPGGWSIVTMNADPQAGRVAVFVCDTANSLWRIYC